MRLVSFQYHQGTSYGIVTSDGVIDLRKHFPDCPDLKTALETKRLEDIRSISEKEADYPLSEIAFLPVIPNPEKIICVGMNYEEHRLEVNREKTAHPTLFLRVPSSQVGHLAPMVIPFESEQLDYEGELAVIIGQEGRRIPEEAAYEHIAGYSCYNDGSIRDWQRHTSQFTAGKNFDKTGAFGPWMVTRDEIADGEVLTLETRLNGRVMQRATTDMLIFSIPQLIHYVSSFTTLKPGDVIVTGTPGGVGFKKNPPVFMKPGDVVEVEISKIGILRNGIVQG